MRVIKNTFSKIVVSITFLVILSSWSQPWGKDADLACSPECITEPAQQSNILVTFAEHAIMFHKNVISPADGPRSHFKPNSSQYTLDAIKKYGFFKGYLLGCDRLMRENNEEWVYPTCLGNYSLVTKKDPVK